MALTRAQLLSGNNNNGITLPGQPQGVIAGAGINISTTGIISVDSSSVTGLVKLNNPFGYNAYVWPGADGTSGEFLQTDGAGNLAWATPQGFAVVTVQPSPAPVPAEVGELWFDCSSGTLNVYQNCVGTTGWFNVAQPGFPVLPGSTSAAPPFVSGTGTQADPYDCTVTTTGSGTTVQIIQTVTVINLAPFQFVPIVDLNAVANGGRFSFTNNYADALGDLTFDILFTDNPPSASGTPYTAAIKVGYGSAYIEAIVNVVAALVVTGGSITGPAYSNQQLTYTPGVPSGGSTPYGSPVIQWFADGVAIGGATGLTYTVTAGNVGKTITATTTISDNSGQTATGTSNSIGPILADPGPLTVTSPGSIAPASAVATTVLNYTAGTFTGGIPTVTPTWVWQKAGVNITGTANAPSYTVVAGDVGSAITVRYTVTDSATPTAATVSQSTPGVTPTAPIPTADWNPGNGMNTSVPGTSNATWNGASGTVTSTGCVVISTDGSSWSQSVSVTTGVTNLYVQWDMSSPGTCGLAPDNTLIQGTVVSGSLINSYSITIDRVPNAFGFGAGSTTAALSSVQTWTPAATISGTNAAGYVTVDAFTGGGSAFEASINGGAFAPVPAAPSTSMPIAPGQTITVRYTTDNTPSASFSGSVKIGDADGVAAIASSPAFTVTNTSSAVFPNSPFSPVGGPNASPAATSEPAPFMPVAIEGTASCLNWGDGSPTLNATNMLMSIGSSVVPTLASVSPVPGNIVNVAWLPSYINGLAHNATATGSFTDTTYTNSYTFTVDKQPAFTLPADPTGAALSTQQTTNSFTPNNFNCPVVVSFTAPTTASSVAMSNVLVSINSGPTTAITLGTTTVTLNPGDDIEILGDTGATNSTAYGLTVTMGAAAPQEWLVTTTAVTPSIQTPTISAPTGSPPALLNPATNTPAGITIIGDAYTPLNGAGATQTLSTWEVYKGGYPLTSTNKITGVTQNAAGAWAQQTSSFGATSIETVTYGSGQYVAVGGSGKLATSPDGINWTQQTSSFGTSAISDAVYGTGLFVAVGDSGKLATSPDGINWTQQTSSFGTDYIYEVAYGGGQFVAVAGNGKLATSPDGINWTQRTSSFGTTGIRSVAYGGGQYVAAGDNGQLATSPDGINWTQRTSSFGTTQIQSVTYGSGQYVAVGGSGKLATSPDGITWTQQTTSFSPITIYEVTYGSGQFVAVSGAGTSQIGTSPDGINWTQQTTSFGGTSIYGVGYGAGLFVAVGQNGKLASSAAPYTVLAIAGAQTEGFLAGDTVISDPAAGGPATILSLDNTQVTVSSSTGWLGDSTQSLKRDPASYTATTGSPYTGTNQAGAADPEVLIPQADLSVSSTYYARVQYATTNASPATSNFSAWSSFATVASFAIAPGTVMGGGYFGGQILVGVGEDDGVNPLVPTLYNLIVAPVTSGALEGQYGGASATGITWNTPAAADSPFATVENQVYGEPATALLRNSATHPVFNTFINGANGPNAGTYDTTNAAGTGIGGFNDWYIPAKNELEILYYNLKPGTTANDTGSGINPNAVPARASNYTAGNPAQTTNALFAGGAESFSTTSSYWSSSQNNLSPSMRNRAWVQSFDNGYQYTVVKSVIHAARAIRRISA